MKIKNPLILLVTFVLVSGQSVNAQDQTASQMTDEDFIRYFNIFQTSEDDINTILSGGDNAVIRMNSMLQAISKQAVTVSRYAFENRTKEMSREVDSLRAKILLFEEKMEGMRAAMKLIDAELHTLREASCQPASISREKSRLVFAEAKERARQIVIGMPQQEVERLLGKPDTFSTSQFGGAPGVDRWVGLICEYQWKANSGIVENRIRIVYNGSNGQNWRVNSFEIK